MWHRRFGRKAWSGVFIACCVILLSGAAARAGGYPDHPIRWIVPFTPAGSTDIVARLVGAALSERLGEPVVIDNRPGAGANIGTQLVVNAPADGYTLLFVSPPSAINATLYEKLPFDFLRDIAPVASLVELPNVMEVSADFPAKTIQEFIAYGKANPGKINLASSGIGTSLHMSGALFMSMTGIQYVHVPYRGAAPALTDLMAGQVQVAFDNLPSSIGFIKAGKLRALGVTAAKRSPLLPDVPAIGEVVPGYEAAIFFGAAAPKNTPPAVIAKLNAAFNDALKDPKVVEKLAALGCTPLIMTPDSFRTYLVAQTEKWGKVVKETGAVAR